MTTITVPEKLAKLVGREHDLDDVSRALRDCAEGYKAQTIGAYQLTCSDESERECVESFRSIFVRNLLPELKFWSQSSFRTANLGARYESGAVSFAENHFATPESADGFKLLVVKVNSHVCVSETPNGPVFGHMDRYDRESVYCGAIHELFEQSAWPFVTELSTTFNAGGLDRLSILLDPSQIDPTRRSFLAAVVNASLQVEHMVEEIRLHTPLTPTIYLVASCVTLNRRRKDSEFVCGIHLVDSCNDEAQVGYVGVGTDPSRFNLALKYGRLKMS